MKYFYLLLSVFITTATYAQHEYQKATNNILLKGAYVVVNADSEPQILDIYIEDDVIKQIASDIEPVHTARIIQLDSQYIYPGFIFPAYIISEKKERNNDRSKKIDYWNPDPNLVGIHTDVTALNKLVESETTLKELYENGITTVQIFPENGFIPGYSSILYTDNNLNQTGMLVSEAYSLYLNPNSWSPAYPQTKIGKYAKLDQIFQEARAELNFDENEKWFRKPQTAKEYTHFANIINRKLPLFMYARDLNTIQQTQDLKQEHNINIIPIQYRSSQTINAHFPKMKYLLVNSDIDDSVDSTEFYKSNYELSDEELGKLWSGIQSAQKNYFIEPFQNARVSYSCTSSGKFKLHKYIKEAIKVGIPKQEIITSLTTTPAKILDLDKYAGQIVPQYIANLTILSMPIDSSDYKVSGIVVKGNYKEMKRDKKSSSSTKELAKLIGTYDLSIIGPEDQFSGKMNITGEGTGTMSIPELEIEESMEDLRLEKDKVTWIINTEILGEEVSAEFEGTIDDKGNISGVTNSVAFGQYKFEANKKPEHE